MVLQKTPIPPRAGWSHVPAKRVVPSPCKKLPSSGPLSLQTDNEPHGQSLDAVHSDSQNPALPQKPWSPQSDCFSQVASGWVTHPSAANTMQQIDKCLDMLQSPKTRERVASSDLSGGPELRPPLPAEKVGQREQRPNHRDATSGRGEAKLERNATVVNGATHRAWHRPQTRSGFRTRRVLR
jgi:hypothetical protein